ncbi:MAG: hypothetical protein ACTS5I_02620, partial [Rhodanobacter sp.]
TMEATIAWSYRLLSEGERRLLQRLSVFLAVLAQPGIAKPQTELPADYEQRLIKNDFTWASKNRDSILTEWRKRYDGKSEKVAGQ